MWLDTRVVLVLRGTGPLPWCPLLAIAAIAVLRDKAPQALRRPGAGPAALSYGCYPVLVRAPASDNAPQPLPASSPGRSIPLLELAGLSAHFRLFWTGSEGGLWPGPLGRLPCRSRAAGRAVGSRGEDLRFFLRPGHGGGKQEGVLAGTITPGGRRAPPGGWAPCWAGGGRTAPIAPRSILARNTDRGRPGP